jgi:hypothetical protein
MASLETNERGVRLLFETWFGFFNIGPGLFYNLSLAP